MEFFFFFCILVDGYDSYEDVVVCLELMRWKVKEDMKKIIRYKLLRYVF